MFADEFVNEADVVDGDLDVLLVLRKRQKVLHLHQVVEVLNVAELVQEFLR